MNKLNKYKVIRYYKVFKFSTIKIVTIVILFNFIKLKHDIK